MGTHCTTDLTYLPESQLSLPPEYSDICPLPVSRPRRTETEEQDSAQVHPGNTVLQSRLQSNSSDRTGLNQQTQIVSSIS